MATYTPNLNLGKPEATDRFGDFRQLFNDNMDKLDNGGGGGGGHTIVDPNGTDLPQEAKLQFTGAVSVTDDNVNGATVVNVSGGNNLILNADIYSTEEKVVGVWTDQKPLYQISYVFTPTALSKSIDVTSLNIEKIIKNVGTFKRNASGTIQEKPLEYRTEAPSSNNYGIQHELRGTNLLIAINGYPYTEILEIRCTIQYTKTTDTAGSGGFQAYGFSPIIYSDVERVVGVWRDNKPLYQKTIQFTNVPQNTSNYLIPTNVSDIDTMVSQEAYGISSSNNVYPLPLALRASTADYNTYSINFQGYIKASNSFRIDTGSQTSVPNGFITFQYTKTTDVAGSGDYNTYGVPTVHYSTNEQVVGTWVDGSTLYEKTWTGLSTATNGANWVTISGITIPDLANVVSIDIYRLAGGTKLTKMPVAECQNNGTGVNVSIVSTTFNGTITTAVVRYTKTS